MLSVARPSTPAQLPQPHVLPAVSSQVAAPRSRGIAAPRDSFATAAPAGPAAARGMLGDALSQVANLRLPIPWPGKGEADKIGWIQKAYPPAKESTAEFGSLHQQVLAGKD